MTRFRHDVRLVFSPTKSTRSDAQARVYVELKLRDLL